MKVNVLSRVGITSAKSKETIVEELGTNNKFGKLLLMKNEDGYFAKFSKNPKMFEILTVQDRPEDVITDIEDFFISEVEEGGPEDAEFFVNFFKNFKKGKGKYADILYTGLDEFAEQYEDIEASTKPSKADKKNALETFANSQHKIYDIIHENGGFYVTDYDFDWEKAPTAGEAILKFIKDEISDSDIKTLKRMIRPRNNKYGKFYLESLEKYEKSGK